MNEVTDVLPSPGRNLVRVRARRRMRRSMEIKERKNMDISTMEHFTVSLGHVKHRTCRSFTYQVGGIAEEDPCPCPGPELWIYVVGISLGSYGLVA